MIFVGFFFGGIVVGPFSDKFGRKITMYLSGLILSVMSLLAAFPEAFWLFALLRCLIGFGIGQWIDRKERLDEKSLSSQRWNTVTCMWCKVLQTFLRHSIKHSTCSSCWEQMTLEETGLGHVPPKTALQKVFRHLLKWKLKLSQSILKEKFVPETIQVLCLPQTKYDIGHRPRLEIPKSYYTFRKLFSHVPWEWLPMPSCSILLNSPATNLLCKITKLHLPFHQEIYLNNEKVHQRGIPN